MLSLATKHIDPEAKLGWPERIGFGAGRYGSNMINGILGAFMTIYFTNVAMLNPGIIASIVAISKLLDGISDLIVGRIVDRTKSKLGKARVWLLRMCIPFAISTVLLFYVPSGWPSMLKYVYVFLMYNIVNAVFLTFMFVPYFSMISLVTKNSYERGLLGNISEIFSTLGNVTVNTFFASLLGYFTSSAETVYTQRAFTLTMIVFSSAMVVLTLICVIFSKERVTDEEKPQEEKSKNEVNFLVAVKSLLRNKYWIMMVVAMFVVFFVVIMFAVVAVYYCQYIFNDLGTYSWMGNSVSIPQMVIMFITPALMKKFGKTKVYTAGIGLVSLGFLGFGLFASSVPLMIFFNVLKGAGMGMAGGMALGMLADTLTYGTWKTGVDAIGVGNAGASAAQKLGLGLGTAVMGWMLDATGFNPELPTQPEAVLTAIQFMYTWLPLILCALVFFMMLFFFKVEKELANRPAEQ